MSQQPHNHKILGPHTQGTKMTKEKVSHWKRFVEWMKFNPPIALSWDGWDDFREEFKAKAFIRYTIVETIPDAFSTFFGPVTRSWTRTKDFCRYRFIKRHRYHLVETGLKPNYYEIETQMLHANFNMLVSYVERQKSAVGMAFDSDNYPRPKGWWWKKYTDWKMPEYGLSYLDWEVTLDKDATLEEQQWDGVSAPTQAQAAREVLVLYRWWTQEWKSTDEIEYPESPSKDGDPFSMFSDKYDRTTPEHIAWQKLGAERDKEIHNMEEQETAMLLRLIKIRKSLWT